MPRTIFEYAVGLPPSWEDATTYTLYLKTDGGKGAAAAPPSLRALPGGGAEQFHPNLVLTRERQGDRDLGRYADAQKQALAQRLPAAKVVRDGKTDLGGLAAHEMDVHVALDRPLPAVAQWHVSLVRDGFCYHAVGTTTKDRFEKDRKEFRALLEAWCRAR